MTAIRCHVSAPDAASPRIRPGARAGVVLAAALAWFGAPGGAAEPNTANPKKPDWVGLDGLLAAGDYEKALPLADGIATQLEPSRRDSDFVVRSIGFVRAMMRHGLAQLKLGRLDDATDSFEKAYRALKDSNFKRLVAIEARNPNAQVQNTLILLDLTMIELLELRMAVLVDRLRFQNLAIHPPGAPKTADDPELRTLVTDWLKDLVFLEKTAREARKALAERFGQAGQSILASPFYQSLAGAFRPSMLAGAKALELRRLGFNPAGEPGEASPSAPTLADAQGFFQQAGTALTEAIDAAAPKGTASMKPAERIEAALLRSEYLIGEGGLRLAAGDPVSASDSLTKAIELRREASVLLKLPKPDSHPDLFVPLLLSAEANLDLAATELRAGDPTRALGRVKEAAKLIARARDLPLSAEHPLRLLLDKLQARIDSGTSAVATKTPQLDAADAAARRLRRALDRTPSLGSDPSL